MKKIIFFLSVILLAALFGGCQLPKNLSQFSPEQVSNKTIGEPQASPVTPSATPCLEGTGCQIEKETPSPATQIDIVNPVRNGEPTIKSFFTSVNQGKLEEAVGLMTDTMVPDQPTYNSYLDMFDSLVSVTIEAIEPYNTPSWTIERELYLVVVNTQTKSGGLQYGWENGENNRWIEVVKQPGTSDWEINSISTSP